MPALRLGCQVLIGITMLIELNSRALLQEFMVTDSDFGGLVFREGECFG